MADTPKEGETVTPEALENKPDAPVTPPLEEKKTEDSEVERLRKENEKIVMERNQLRNKLEAEERAKADREAKELEQKEEFKTLYEQEKAKNEESERERQAEEDKKAVRETTDNVLEDYSDEVKALAEDTGLSLSDVTEDAVAEFKGKLDKIHTRLGGEKVTPNNPGTPSSKKEYSGQELREILNDPVKRDEYYRNKGGAAELMMTPQS